MDLFKAIFADSSSSSDEEDDDKNNNMATSTVITTQGKWQDLSAIINTGGPPSSSFNENSSHRNMTALITSLQEERTRSSPQNGRSSHEGRVPSVSEEKLADTHQESASSTAFGPALPPGKFAVVFVLPLPHLTLIHLFIYCCCCLFRFGELRCSSFACKKRFLSSFRSTRTQKEERQVSPQPAQDKETQS